MPDYIDGMSQRVLRRRRNRVMTNRPDPGLSPLTPRARGPVLPGMHATYPLDVARGERQVDRAEWAALINELMTAETKGKKEPFARKLGINARTVSRWLDQEVDASEDSVRLVARTFNRQPMELLMRVGYYQPSDIQPAPGPTPAEVAADPALKVIEESGYPPHVKARMRERLHQMRRQREAAEVEEVKWWLDQWGQGA